MIGFGMWCVAYEVRHTRCAVHDGPRAGGVHDGRHVLAVGWCPKLFRGHVQHTAWDLKLLVHIDLRIETPISTDHKIIRIIRNLAAICFVGSGHEKQIDCCD